MALGIIIGLLIALVLLAIELLLVQRTQSTLIDKGRSMAQHIAPQKGFIGMAEDTTAEELLLAE